MRRASTHRTHVGPPQAGSPLSVVALLVGDPGAAELWTLRRLADCGGTLHVVSGRSARNVPMARRLRRLVRDHGVVGVVSRLVAARTVGRREEHREADELDRLLDIDELRRWWARSGLEPLPVASLNDPEARAVIASLRPDLIVRVSGGILHRGTFSLARIGTLNIHHGLAGAIRGMWSIPWGIVESRRDWIGATVHVIDEGIDTGTVLWTGAPQVSAGDTGTTLYFRAHVEAVEHLARVVHVGGKGMDGPLAGRDGDCRSRRVSIRAGRRGLAPLPSRGSRRAGARRLRGVHPMITPTGALLAAATSRHHRGGVIVNEHTLDVAETRKHVDVLGRWFDFVQEPEVPERLERPGRRPFCLLTFDDGKRQNAAETAPALERLGVPAVFYVVARFLDRGEPLWFDDYEALVDALGAPPRGLGGAVKQLPFAILMERLERALAGARRAPTAPATRCGRCRGTTRAASTSVASRSARTASITQSCRARRPPTPWPTCARASPPSPSSWGCHAAPSRSPTAITRRSWPAAPSSARSRP